MAFWVAIAHAPVLHRSVPPASLFVLIVVQESLDRVWLLPNARGRYVRVRAGGHDDAPGCLELGGGQGEVEGRVVVGLRCV